MLLLLLLSLIFCSLAFEQVYVSDVSEKTSLRNLNPITGLIFIDKDYDFRAHEIVKAFVSVDVFDCFGHGKITMCMQEFCVDIDIPNNAKDVIKTDITALLTDYTYVYGGEYKSLSEFAFEIFTDEESLIVKINRVEFSVKYLDTDDMFIHDAADVLHFDIKMTPEDLEAIVSDPVAEEYYRCNVTFNGFTYTFAGCRFKGAVSSLVQCCTPGPRLNENECRKLSLKIDTYEFRKDKLDGEYIFPKREQKRRIHDQKKINLLGMESRSKDSVLHPTIPMRSYYDQMVEFVGGEFARLSGAYMASSRYATVTMNGEYQGLYMAIAQTDDKFTQWNFGDDANGGEGQLWKQLFFRRNPTEEYFLDTLKEGDDEEGSQDDILEFSHWLNSVDIDDPATKETFAEWVDIDAVLSLMAFSHTTGAFDVLISMKASHANPDRPDFDDYEFSNMYIYKHDKKDGTSKYVIIGHDFGSVATGFNALRTRKWYDDDFDEEYVCEGGEFVKNAGPTKKLYILPAQCTPFFKILKTHFWNEYLVKFAEVVEDVITEETIASKIATAKGIIQRYISREPRGIPTMPEWLESIENTEFRLNVWRQEEIEKMQEMGYIYIPLQTN